MKRHVVRIGKLVAGGVFVALGVAGLFLPFLQGIVFLVIGLTLLSSESERVRRWLEGFKQWARDKRAGTKRREDDRRERPTG